MSEFPAITELVPHAAPMLALEELVEWRDGFARARMTVRDDADSVMTLEWMAQTVAACLGQEAYLRGDGVRVGMVVACREMRIERPRLSAGEALVLTARRVRGTDSISHFDTETRDARSEVVSAATLTLVHGERPPDQRATGSRP